MEKIFNEKYAVLNAGQKKAVDTIDGPVFVMAGPGTGKTQILTLRIANILRQAVDIEPENVLALTFTNAASYNMRDRLASIVGGELAYRVHIATFHSFAEDMIKRFPEYFKKYESARLLSPIEQVEMLEKIVHDMPDIVHFSKFKQREGTIKSISFSLGKIKSEGLSPDQFIAQINEHYHIERESENMFYKRKSGNNNKGDIKMSELVRLDNRRDKSLELAEIYRKYQKTLTEKKFYDFSDLILSCVSELESDSNFQADIQSQYHYILVDEHQDTNDAQNRILHALIDNPVWKGRPNVFAVGDSKQAIYRFAGASEKSYAHLLSKLSDVALIELEHNYRSHQNILDRSHSLISKSGHHSEEPALEAFFDHGGTVQYRLFQNYKMETLYIAQDIKKRIDAGMNPNEIAVLYRSNKEGEDIHNLLSIYGISVCDFSKKNILKDPDILKIFLLLRAVYDLEDDEILAKSLFIDFLNLDMFAVQRIINASQQAKKDIHKKIYSVISEPSRLGALGLSEEKQKQFLNFAQMLTDAKRKSENTDFISFFSWFIRHSGMLNYVLGHLDSAQGIAKVEKLFDEIKKESLARDQFEFSDFIHYLNTLKKHSIPMNMGNTMTNGVQLMTFHGSKGLEFDVVYIIKALQKRKMGSDIWLPFEDFGDGDIDDERRLLYVAITRAKHECYISSHILNQEGKEKNESQFIADIEGLEKIDMNEWEQEHVSDTADFFGEEYGHITSLMNVEYIKQLFLAKQLSVSALNNYLESPLKYFFRNLVRLPEPRSHFLDFGNLMHGSLEHFFNVCRESGKILGADILKKSFQCILESESYYTEFEDRAWEALESYHAYHRESFVVPVENELTIRGMPFETKAGDIIYLSGAVDKITRNPDGSLSVWDYKTGRVYSEVDKHRREKMKRQATFYKMLLQNAYGGKYNFKTATFDFLEKNKMGEYECQSFEITQSDVEELKTQIQLLVDDIFKGTLLTKNFSLDSTNAELLEFLEVMRGPRTKEQPSLFIKDEK